MTANPPSPPSPWNAFDRLYCITLADRPDRRRSAEEQFARVGLAGRVEFVVVQRHPTDSEQGIYESHMRCLNQGLAAGARTIVVFEDDVLFDRFSPPALADAVAFLNAGTPWDVFFLGGFAHSIRNTASPFVLHIRYRCAAHAYAVNRPFAETLVQTPWHNVAFDDFIRSLDSPRLYALYPSIAFQSNAASDNAKRAWNVKIWKFLGKLQTFQRWNEFRLRHMTAFVLSNVALALLLILLVLIWRGIL
jgi:GR25 family glycosyltransferase involved in LPS biosynthesis